MHFFFEKPEGCGYGRSAHGITNDWGRGRTLRVVTQGLQHVRRLTRRPFGLLQHIEDVAQLTQQTRIAETGRGSVLERQVTQQRGIIHDLQQRVGVGVGDVILQTRISGLVIITGRQVSQ